MSTSCPPIPTMQDAVLAWARNQEGRTILFSAFRAMGPSAHWGVRLSTSASLMLRWFPLRFSASTPTNFSVNSVTAPKIVLFLRGLE